ncbi:MAG: TolC family protein [Pseudomonadota bacterium]
MSRVKTRKTKILSGVSALALYALCVPFGAHAETIEQTLISALTHHPQVESAQAALRTAEQSQKEQYSAYFPEIDVNATGGRIFGNNSTSRGLSVTRGEGYSHLWEGSVAARQLIFDGLETKNRVSAARAETKAAHHSLQDTRENLAFRTTQTFVNLLRVQRGLGLLRGQEKTVKDYLDRITSMVEDGAADEAELQQATDVSVILDNFIADYEGQLQTLESDYVELTGHLPENELEQPTIALDQIPQDVNEAIEIAKSTHPLLRAAKMQSNSAMFDMEAERSTFAPKFDGELSYLKRDQDDIIGGELEDGKAVVRMNWGFETGGGQKARIKQRKFEHKQALARIAEVERQVERSVRQAYAELYTASKQHENQRRRHELNKKLLETYEVQFEGALISVLQLMQADNQVLITKLESSNAQMRVLAAQYGVLAAMGQLQKSMNLEIASSHPARDEH